MVKLVDTPDLGSGAARFVGSSPILGKTTRVMIQSLPRKQANRLACVSDSKGFAMPMAANPRPEGESYPGHISERFFRNGNQGETLFR